MLLTKFGRSTASGKGKNDAVILSSGRLISVGIGNSFLDARFSEFLYREIANVNDGNPVSVQSF